jgi:hypothetical protein
MNEYTLRRIGTCLRRSPLAQGTARQTHMLELQGFSAWIDIDGVNLLQHDVKISDDRNSVSCWIVSEVGKVRLISFSRGSHNSPVGFIELCN